MEEGIIELDDILVAELMENVDLNSKIGELLQIYGIKDTYQLMESKTHLLLPKNKKIRSFLTSSDSS